MMARAKALPRFYFNLRSPYSWLAVHDLSTVYPHVADAVEWRPFWEPGKQSEQLLEQAGGQFVYTPMSREKHLYILGDVRRLAAARGLDVSWPIDRDPCWEVAHLAYLEAHRAGLGRPFATAVSRARWEQGVEISDPERIGRIGAGLGLDPERMAAAWQNPELIDEGTRALMDLYRDSVFGVPYFVSGRERFWGIDRLPAFAALVSGRAAGAEPGLSSPAHAAVVGEPALAVPAPGGEGGHAGGCG